MFDTYVQSIEQVFTVSPRTHWQTRSNDAKPITTKVANYYGKKEKGC